MGLISLFFRVLLLGRELVFPIFSNLIRTELMIVEHGAVLCEAANHAIQANGYISIIRLVQSIDNGKDVAGDVAVGFVVKAGCRDRRRLADSS